MDQVTMDEFIDSLFYPFDKEPNPSMKIIYYDMLKNYTEPIVAKAIKQCVKNEQFPLVPSNLNKYLPKQDIKTAFRDCIDTFGVDDKIREFKRLDDGTFGFDKTNKEKCLEYCETKYGPAMAELLRMRGSEFADSKPNSVNQDFLVKELNQIYTEQQTQLALSYKENNKGLCTEVKKMLNQ